MKTHLSLTEVPFAIFVTIPAFSLENYNPISVLYGFWSWPRINNFLLLDLSCFICLISNLICFSKVLFLIVLVGVRFSFLGLMYDVLMWR